MTQNQLLVNPISAEDIGLTIKKIKTSKAQEQTASQAFFNTKVC